MLAIQCELESVCASFTVNVSTHDFGEERSLDRSSRTLTNISIQSLYQASPFLDVDAKKYDLD